MASSVCFVPYLSLLFVFSVPFPQPHVAFASIAKVMFFFPKCYLVCCCCCCCCIYTCGRVMGERRGWNVFSFFIAFFNAIPCSRIDLELSACLRAGALHRTAHACCPSLSSRTAAQKAGPPACRAL